MRRIPWTTTPSGGSLRASCRSTARPRAADVLDLLKFLTHLAFAGTIFLCSVALTYVMTRFVRVMDMPNPRSSHSRPVHHPHEACHDIRQSNRAEEYRACKSE